MRGAPWWFGWLLDRRDPLPFAVTTCNRLLPSSQVGAETFRLCRQLCDGVLLVDNAAISAAIKDVFNETRSILEPAGAVAVAGAKAFLKENGHQVRLSADCGSM
eukprot:GHRQ01031478.1.p2 GENE.GHRQ01031478.1~~GHRQ01031478.1.p2  ORF type:complete len:104 (-),score=16.16 GHRQ01031478.1:127-438(-)